MRTVSFAVVVFAVGALVTSACNGSSSGGGGAGGGGGSANFLGCSTGGFAGACPECVQTNCGTETASQQSACTALLSCTSSCDCNDAACLQACQPMSTDACQMAQTELGSCISDKCEVCLPAEGEGGSGGAGGGAGGIGGATAGAGAGGIGGGGDVSYSCYVDSTKQCTQGTGSAFAAMQAQSFCAMGGVFGAMCPANGVLGCCANGPGATCYYTGLMYDAGKLAGACAQGGGTWVATPP